MTADHSKTNLLGLAQGELEQWFVSNADPDQLLLPPEEALDELDRLAAQAADMLSSGSTDQADTLETADLRTHWDIAAGDTRLRDSNWLVRLVGSDADPGGLASRTIVAMRV